MTTIQLIAVGFVLWFVMSPSCWSGRRLQLFTSLRFTPVVVTTSTTTGAIMKTTVLATAHEPVINMICPLHYLQEKLNYTKVPEDCCLEECYKMLGQNLESILDGGGD